MTLLRAQRICKAFAGVPVLEEVSWYLEAGRKIGLVGANGSGKSTLLEILAGRLPPDSGTVERARDLRLGYLPQAATLRGERSLVEEVGEALRPLRDMEAEIAALEQRMARQQATPQDMQRYGWLLETFAAQGGYAMPARVEATLLGLGFQKTDLHKPVAQLSGGQKNMAALAQVLLQEPDLLLLDEPSNHLDLAAVEWLEDFLQAYRGAVVVVSHDRYFLDRVVEEIAELEGHRLHLYRGNYSAYVAAKAARREQQRRAHAQQQAEIRRQEEFIRRNLAGQKSRQAQSRRKRLARLERLEAPQTRPDKPALAFTPARREGHEVIVCHKVWKAYGEQAVLRGVSCRIYRGEKVALMGPNGAGKTTFLRLLLGQEQPDRGVVRLGPHVVVGYYDQELHSLRPERSVLEEVWEAAPHKTLEEMRTYLGRFLFRGDAVFQPVGQLSGGEKSRVALAKLVLSQANLLVLDEPTNHLDIPAREALEQALAAYPGTLLVVSHDRYFLDRVATRLLYLRDGTWEDYPGTYSEYQAHLAARPAAPVSARPPRPAPAARPPRRRKVSAIERDIAAAEAELAALQEEMQAQDGRNWQRLAELSQQQQAVAERLEQLLHEWEASMLAEEGDRRAGHR
ncbi:MAG: ABC transporter [Candidatus Tectimicrobiota bacterium]|nr:MAG: ABC transporter [Candidatus Tectomicrobia bacterium]